MRHSSGVHEGFIYQLFAPSIDFGQSQASNVSGQSKLILSFLRSSRDLRTRLETANHRRSLLDYLEEGYETDVHRLTLLHTELSICKLKSKMKGWCLQFLISLCTFNFLKTSWHIRSLKCL